MALIDFRNRKITCKIVYYGPGRAGKTTNLLYIYRSLQDTHKGRLIIIDTKGERTLFFDLLPISIDKVNGLDICFQLYTVPGQEIYYYARRIVLKGVDGIVFVADSLHLQRFKNIESFEEMKKYLASWGLTLTEIPLVFQYNKRDLIDKGLPLLSIEELQNDLNKELKAPYFPASAIKGIGVIETFKEIAKLSIRHIAQKYLRKEGIL